METQAPKLWFKRKEYGWGWTPASVEGWIVTIGYILFVLAYVVEIAGTTEERQLSFMGISPIIIATLSLLAICFLKGEKPKWQWGKPKE